MIEHSITIYNAHYDRTYFPVLLYIIHTMIERTFQYYYI